MDIEISDLYEGDRVELHPATDLWMRGARYGEILSIGRTRVTVKLDRLPTPVRLYPRDIARAFEPCPGHYDDDYTLMSGAGIGEPTFCNGRCQA
jgi:hypothetical protein